MHLRIPVDVGEEPPRLGERRHPVTLRPPSDQPRDASDPERGDEPDPYPPFFEEMERRKKAPNISEGEARRVLGWPPKAGPARAARTIDRPDPRKQPSVPP